MNENNINENNNNITHKAKPEMTAGEMLRAARTTGRRKREIQTVAKLLCIREEFLQALEDGNYTRIPETVYILGFARNYAVELGLDPDEITAKIKREMGLIADKDDDDASADDESVAAAAPVKENAAPAKPGAFAAFLRHNWIWIVSTIVAIALILVGAVIFAPIGDNSNAANSVVVSDSAEIVAPVAPVVKEPTFKMPIREPFGTENREGADIVLQATQESWIRVDDPRGNSVFSRVLMPGDVYYVPAGGRHKAIFGNAGGVDVWVKGKLIPKVGADHVRKSGILLNADSLLTVGNQN